MYVVCIKFYKFTSVTSFDVGLLVTEVIDVDMIEFLDYAPSTGATLNYCLASE